MENRELETMKRDARTRVVSLREISVSFPSEREKGVGRSRGRKGGLERGMDFMPRARYMAAATPGQK